MRRAFSPLSSSDLQNSEQGSATNLPNPQDVEHDPPQEPPVDSSNSQDPERGSPVNLSDSQNLERESPASSSDSQGPEQDSIEDREQYKIYEFFCRITHELMDNPVSASDEMSPWLTKYYNQLLD